jgi:hypothetical protein
MVNLFRDQREGSLGGCAIFVAEEYGVASRNERKCSFSLTDLDTLGIPLLFFEHRFNHSPVNL